MSATLEDVLVRIDNLMWLGGMIYADGLPYALSEFLDDAPTDLSEFTSFWKLAEDEDVSDGEMADEFRAFCCQRNLTGFLFQASVPHTLHRANGYTFSWGYYRTQWMYAVSVEDMASKATAFSELCIASDRAKSAA
jgi:hypothetical protein